MIRTVRDFPSMAGIGTYAVSEICGWWDPVDGVAAVAGQVDSPPEIRRGIFRRMTRPLLNVHHVEMLR
jgi:hypothetical protein